MPRIRHFLTTASLLVFAAWAIHAYRSGVLDAEFLVYGQSGVNAGGTSTGRGQQNQNAIPPLSPELKKRALSLAKTCIDKSPEKYRSIGRSPLVFDKATFSMDAPDRVFIEIPEKKPTGAPQGLSIQVNIKTGQCMRGIQE